MECRLRIPRPRTNRCHSANYMLFSSPCPIAHAPRVRLPSCSCSRPLSCSLLQPAAAFLRRRPSPARRPRPPGPLFPSRINSRNSPPPQTAPPPTAQVLKAPLSYRNLHGPAGVDARRVRGVTHGDAQAGQTRTHVHAHRQAHPYAHPHGSGRSCGRCRRPAHHRPIPPPQGGPRHDPPDPAGRPVPLRQGRCDLRQPGGPAAEAP